jgi:hypothetical protein
MWVSHCSKPTMSLRVWNSMGRFPNSANRNMIGCQRTHFDMRHHIHLRALLKNLLVRVFQVASPTFNATWNLEAPKPWLDRIWVPNMWLQLLLLSVKCLMAYMIVHIEALKNYNSSYKLLATHTSKIITIKRKYICWYCWTIMTCLDKNTRLGLRG